MPVDHYPPSLLFEVDSGDSPRLVNRFAVWIVDTNALVCCVDCGIAINPDILMERLNIDLGARIKPLLNPVPVRFFE